METSTRFSEHASPRVRAFSLARLSLLLLGLVGQPASAGTIPFPAAPPLPEETVALLEQGAPAPQGRMVECQSLVEKPVLWTSWQNTTPVVVVAPAPARTERAKRSLAPPARGFHVGG